MTASDSVLRRVRKTALVLSGAGAAVAFVAFGARAGVSLTIGAAIVIFNFFVLEKVMGGFLAPRTGMRFSDVAVPAMGFLGILLLLSLVLRWKEFDILAGLAGLSVIVLAIGWEGIRGLTGHGNGEQAGRDSGEQAGPESREQTGQESREQDGEKPN